MKIEVRCPKCYSLLIYYRIKEQTFQCRNCGHTDKNFIKVEKK